MEEFAAAGALKPAAAADFAQATGHYATRVTVTCNGRSVSGPLVGTCWDELGITEGTVVRIRTELGGDEESRRALRELANLFQALTRP